MILIAIERNQIKDKIYEYLINTLKFTHAGACGFLANLQAESGCMTNMVEGLLIQRLSEDGETEWKRPVNNYLNMVMNNLLYTARITKGIITKEQFLSPRHRHYGYGLCQWTTDARKKRLWDNTIGNGKSIDDLDGQLETLRQELTGVYKGTLTVCQCAVSATECAESVLRNFEQPKITDSIISARKQYAKEYDNLYRDYRKKVETVSYDVNAVLQVASGEVGYLEKRSNAQLDSKTANAGSANYTKYWKRMKVSYQGQAWCDCFVSWCFMAAYGREAADKLLCGGLMSFYTPQSAQLYKDKGQWHTGSDAKAGDQIFFKNSQRIHHTGIVERVANGRVYTIEGNTSGASGVIANGGGVCRKSYVIGDSRIAGYGRPNYGTVSKKATMPIAKEGVYMFEVSTLKKGSQGAQVKFLTRLLAGYGYKFSHTGYYGDVTDKAVRDYQSKHDLEVDGICGQQTFKSLIGF